MGAFGFHGCTCSHVTRCRCSKEVRFGLFSVAWPLQLLRHWWWKPAGPKKAPMRNQWLLCMQADILDIGNWKCSNSSCSFPHRNHIQMQTNTQSLTRDTKTSTPYTWQVLTRRPAVKLLEVVSKICRVMRLVLQKHARRPISRLCRVCAQAFQFHSASLFSLALVSRKNALALSYHILPWYPW